MAGYWRRPEETAKALDANGYLATGDIGVMDEAGFIRIVDRKSDMILVSGFNVYPNEIEDVAASAPGILEAAAIGVHDDKTGEAVKLFVVRADPNVTVDDVRRHCEARLTNYKRPRISNSSKTCRRRPSARFSAANSATFDPRGQDGLLSKPKKRGLLGSSRSFYRGAYKAR